MLYFFLLSNAFAPPPRFFCHFPLFTLLHTALEYVSLLRPGGAEQKDDARETAALPSFSTAARRRRAKGKNLTREKKLSFWFF